MDGNLQKQEIKKSFTFDTKKKTDLYDGVFGKSLYTVDKEEEVKKKDYKEQINELREREKLMGRNTVSEKKTTVLDRLKAKNEEKNEEKTGRQKVAERLSEFKAANDRKMTDMEGTETSRKFFDNIEDEEHTFRSKLAAFDYKNMLKNASYLVKGKKGTRTKHSPSMQAILDRFAELEQVLSWQIAKSDDLYDAQVNSITSILRQACLACSEYIDTHNSSRAEGMERKRLVKLMYDQISKESMMFENRAKAFKSVRAESGKKSWLDVFATVRRERIVPGNGVKITRGGAGTSDVYIVERNGVKSYLKREETLPGYYGDDVIGAYAENLFAKNKLYQDRTSETLKDIPKEELDKKAKDIEIECNMIKAFVSALKRCVIPAGPTRDVLDRCNATALLLHLRELTESEKTFDARMTRAPYKNTEFGKFMIRMQGNLEKAQMQASEADMDKYANILEIAYNMARNLYKSMNGTDIAVNAALINEGDSISKRNVATSRLAELLGIGHIVVRSEMKDVVIDGEEQRCIEMEDGGTMNTSSATKKSEYYEKVNSKGVVTQNGKRFMYSPEALRDLCSLQVLDVISVQLDRHNGNYVTDADVTDNEVVFNKIKGIDNDMAFGELDYNTIMKEKIMRLKNIEDRAGNMTLFGMDVKLAKRILAIAPEMLDYVMADLLNKKEREALKNRFRGVQAAIRRQMSKEAKLKAKNKKFRSKFIKDQAGWTSLRDHVNQMGKTARGRKEISDYSYINIKAVGNKMQQEMKSDGGHDIYAVY